MLERLHGICTLQVGRRNDNISDRTVLHEMPCIGGNGIVRELLHCHACHDVCKSHDLSNDGTACADNESTRSRRHSAMIPRNCIDGVDLDRNRSIFG